MKNLVSPGRGASCPRARLSRGVTRCLAAATLALLTLSLPAGATTLEETNFSKQVAGAEKVFLADVLATRCDWAGEGANRRIATYVRVRVIESVKGDALGEFELDFTGGTVGDETLRISGMPQPKPGTREIFFVTGNGTHLCPLVGFWHGRLKIWRGDNASPDRVCRHDGRPLMQLTEIGRSSEKERPAPTVERSVDAGMTVPEFLAAVRTENAKQEAAQR